MKYLTMNEFAKEKNVSYLTIKNNISKIKGVIKHKVRGRLVYAIPENANFRARKQGRPSDRELLDGWGD